MIKATRVNNRVVAFIQGKLYEKEFKPEELISVFEAIANVDEGDNAEIESIKAMFISEDLATTKAVAESQKVLKSAKRAQNLLHFIDDIREFSHDYFYVQGDSLYLKGIPLSIPKNIAEKFIESLDDEAEFNKLKNFWMLLSLNPNSRCREDLFRFLDNHDFTITPGGYFVAYRNVEHYSGGQEDEDFVKEITDIHRKVRAWKKSPANYEVYKTENGYQKAKVGNPITEEGAELIGNLADIFNNMDAYSDTVYTDAHSRTTRIVMGSPVSIDRNRCDTNPTNQCSAGLHVARYNWLSQGYFGAKGIVVIVNPMHVVAVPYADAGKLRCCEYLPIDFIEYDEEGQIIPISTEEAEIEYAEYTSEELESLIEESKDSIVDHCTKSIIGDEFTVNQLKDILSNYRKSIDDIKQELKDKVVKL